MLRQVWALKAPAIAEILLRVQRAAGGCRADQDCPTGSYCMMGAGKIKPFRCHGQDDVLEYYVQPHGIGYCVLAMALVWVVCDALAQLTINSLWSRIEQSVVTRNCGLVMDYIHSTGVDPKGESLECFKHLETVCNLWAMMLCIWSVLQALLTLLTSTAYIILAGHAYLALTSILVLLTQASVASLPSVLMRALRRHHANLKALAMSSPTDQFSAIEGAAKSFARQGLLH